MEILKSIGNPYLSELFGGTISNYNPIPKLYGGGENDGIIGAVAGLLSDISIGSNDDDSDTSEWNYEVCNRIGNFIKDKKKEYQKKKRLCRNFGFYSEK